MKKNYLITLLLFLCVPIIYAQDYNFEKQNETYASLVNATPVFTEPWNSIEDAPSIGLPFNFSLFGKPIDVVYFTGNGLATEFEFEGKFYSSVLFASPELIDLAALDPTADPQTTVTTKLEGVVGSRILKIQVSNAASYYEFAEFDSSTQIVDFQIWLHETTNVISYHYGPNNIVDLEDFAYDGIMGCGLVELSYEGIEDDNLINPIQKSFLLHGSSNAPILKINQNAFLLDYPNTGVIYRFTPKTLSVDHQEKAPTTITLFPNPTENLLRINGDFDVNVSYSIFDMSGKKLKQGKVTDQTIDVSLLSSGIYILKLDNQSQALKFIKK